MTQIYSTLTSHCTIKRNNQVLCGANMEAAALKYRRTLTRAATQVATYTGRLTIQEWLTVSMEAEASDVGTRLYSVYIYVYGVCGHKTG